MGFRLRIITPQAVFFDKEIEMVKCRGVGGEFAILKNHIPYVTELVIAPVEILFHEERLELAMSGGYIYVEEDKTTIIANTAEWSHEIDVDRAQSARERAEERLRNMGADIDVQKAEVALKRATTRLTVANRHK